MMPRRRRRGGRPSARADGRLLPACTRGKSYKFVRSANIGPLTVPATDSIFTWNFALSDLPSASEFTNLFQEYRICKVVQTFTWAAAAGTTSVAYPTIFVADSTSGYTATGLNDIVQRRYRRLCFNASKTIHSVAVKPAVRFDVGATTSNHGIMVSPWLSSGNSSVVHAGIVAFLQDYNTTLGTGALRLVEEFHIETRGLV